MVFSPHVVLNVRQEIRTPFRILIGFWFVAALVVALFAQTLWIMALAGLALAGSIGLAWWLLRPRPGSLARLVIDTSRQIIYWAHHGYEPEELPFLTLKAFVLQTSAVTRLATLWALDLTGRRVELGHAPAAELEGVAVELSRITEVPLWYERQTPSPDPEVDIDLYTHRRAIASDPSEISP